MSLMLLKMFTFVGQQKVMKTILNIFQIFVIWLSTALCAIIGLLLIPFIGQKKSIRATSSIWSNIVLGISGAKLVVKGKENLDNTKGVIYTANHESGYDIPAIFKAIPQPLFYLAKAELKKIPFFGWYMSAVGMIFVDRKSRSRAKESLIKAGDEIKKGKNIISFPEGTRSRDGEIQMFRRGSFILALENNIDVVPVAVVGTRQINPPGYEISPGTATVIIGKPIDVSKWDTEQPDVLAKYVEDTVKEMVRKERGEAGSAE